MTEDVERPTTWAMLAGGVALPLVTIGVEAMTGMCAEIFVDPIPDWWRLAMLLSVPLAVFLGVRHVEEGRAPSAWLAFLMGIALAAAALLTVVFLPMLPFAILGLLVGIGILPLTPAISLWALLQVQQRLAPLDHDTRRWRAAGALIGALVMLVADVPAALTRTSIDRYAAGDVAGALALAGLLDQDRLTAMAHGAQVKPSGLPSFLTSAASDHWPDEGAARELLFLSTGASFSASSPPRLRLFGSRSRSTWDTEQGGTEVGARVADLTLAASRIDGEVMADANAAYLEWTAEVANTGRGPAEARLTLAMPEGAVASRATLWVNGEPREASVGARGAVRAAYEGVVRQQRDPLLVTTDGSGRLMVQMFPVPAGGRMKIRIGMTAPLEILPDGSRQVGLPAIVQRNFAPPTQLRHDVRVTGGTASTISLLAAQQQRDGMVAIAGSVPDAELAGRHLRILAAPVQTPSVTFGTLDGITVEQRISQARAVVPSGTLSIVLDASATNRESASPLRTALGVIPDGAVVGLMVAGAETTVVPAAPWSAAQRRRFEAAIAAERFGKGYDSVGALTRALDAGETILWVHGPQPVRFAASSAALSSALERLGRNRPALVRFQAVPGPAFGIERARWLETARDVAPSSGKALGLDRLLGQLTGSMPVWEATRVEGTGAGKQATGGAHIVRLWAAADLAGAGGKDRGAAAARAAKLGLVTSDTGAVVLETDREYAANGLAEPLSEVPAVPEPATWATLIIGFLLLGWRLRARRAAQVAELAA